MSVNPTSLTALADAFGSDKGTISGARHSYTLLYDTLLTGMRDGRDTRILELGLARGGPEVGGDADRRITGAPSIDMWLNYFSDPQIVGFDISDFSHLQDDRFTFVRGDCGKEADLERIFAPGDRFDLVLDDASHASFHQQLCLARLFEGLRPGGLYLIEDLHWVPEEYERTLPRVPRTRDWLLDFCKSGSLAPTAAVPPEAATALRDGIMSVQLFDEHTLDALGRLHTTRRGEGTSLGRRWRSLSAFGRLVDPTFLLFCLRRLASAFRNEEFVVRQNIKLAVIQKAW